MSPSVSDMVTFVDILIVYDFVIGVVVVVVAVIIGGGVVVLVDGSRVLLELLVDGPGVLL